MVRTESRFGGYDVLEHPTAHSGVRAPDDPFPPGEAKQARGSLPPGEETDAAIPGWDNLWVDLGGEG